MEIKIDSLISFEKIFTDTESVFAKVDKNGSVVLIKDNIPVYIISKPEYQPTNNVKEEEFKPQKTLHEAMEIVLQNAPNNEMHASELADVIFKRKLYTQRNGEKAQYNQIRARSGHYPDMFEALPGNIIKLKER